MDKEELLEIANVVSAVFLLDQDVEIGEIIKRLKLIGRIIRKGASKEQQQVFKGWLINRVLGIRWSLSMTTGQITD